MNAQTKPSIFGKKYGGRAALVFCVFSAMALRGADLSTNNIDPIITTNLDSLGVPIVLEPPARRALREYFERLPEIPYARWIDGDPCDMTEVFKWKTLFEAGRARFHEGLDAYVVRGVVSQIIDGGILVRKSSGSEPVFIANCKDESNLVDGDYVKIIAMQVGRYQFATVLGANKSVLKYDCGKRITKTTIPEHIARITSAGIIQIQRP